MLPYALAFFFCGGFWEQSGPHLAVLKDYYWLCLQCDPTSGQGTISGARD